MYLVITLLLFNTMRKQDYYDTNNLHSMVKIANFTYGCRVLMIRSNWGSIFTVVLYVCGGTLREKRLNTRSYFYMDNL